MRFFDRLETRLLLEAHVEGDGFRVVMDSIQRGVVDVSQASEEGCLGSKRDIMGRRVPLFFSNSRLCLIGTTIPNTRTRTNIGWANVVKIKRESRTKPCLAAGELPSGGVLIARSSHPNASQDWPLTPRCGSILESAGDADDC